MAHDLADDILPVMGWYPRKDQKTEVAEPTVDKPYRFINLF